MGNQTTRLQRSEKPPPPGLPAMFGRYEAMVAGELSQAVPLLSPAALAAALAAELSNVMRYHLGWVD